MKFLREWGIYILISVLIILSRLFIWAPVDVSGHSMDPTLADGQRLIMIKSKNIERGDIVVANEEEEDKKIIKRVIGLPGDKISFNNDVLTINGKKVDEPYLNEYKELFKKDKLQSTYSSDKFMQNIAASSSAFTVNAEGKSSFEVIVPDGQYYLLGDNRLVSKDSRMVGSFKKEDIVGKAKLRIWPMKSIGTIK